MAEAPQSADAEQSRPTSAGIYDAYLGGTSHTTLEREVADKLRQAVPEVPAMAWANRAFHQRAVRWLAEQGIDQFVDLGSGLPTQDNTHQVAHRVIPDARVLYVDYDERTAELGHELVEDNERTAFLRADLRQPDAVLTSPALRDLIDLDRPVAVIATAVVHFVDTADDPWGMIRRYMDATTSGSYLVLNHITSDKQPAEKTQALYGIYRGSSEMIFMRHFEDVEYFFDGLELVPPYEGADSVLTFLGLWGCEDPAAADDDTSRWAYCGVARKP